MSTAITAAAAAAAHPSSISAHPRRRPLRVATPPTLPSPSSSFHTSPDSSCPASHNMNLRKGATFHSRSSPSTTETDPVLDIPSLPRRSPTCPRSLEQAVLAAAEERMASLIGQFERNLRSPSHRRRSQDTAASDSHSPTHPSRDDLPMSRGLLDGMMDVDSPPSPPLMQNTPARRHQHTSDSGIGSSISGASGKGKQRPASINDFRNSTNTLVKEKAVQRGSTVSSTEQGTNRPFSAVTRSISSDSQDGQSDANQHTLSAPARKHIQRFIILPLLQNKTLKDFHSLVKSVPGRVSEKEITCLRDLEKSLLLLAPNYSASVQSYVKFCEVFVQCLHTTAGHLNDQDQRRPADKPYTNGYFLDLVGQIRQYAATMAAARARELAATESGEDAGYSSYVFTSPLFLHLDSPLDSGEELVLEGGLAKTGRPAELVRKKDGKAVSLSTGEAYKPESAKVPAFKRALSETEDEEAQRSMARRKKNAPPEPMKRCKECHKEFARPCDLTKHAKTHSRPWKCSERSCMYYSKGWPTEKERDRHVNDKHSAAPTLYHCNFSPCPYKSKRESNCKQHMEKTHGWVYTRSKANGKGKRGSTDGSPQSATMSTPASNFMEIQTPVSVPAASPYIPFDNFEPFSNTYGAFPPTPVLNESMESFSRFYENNGESSSMANNGALKFPTPNSDVLDSPFTPSFDNIASSNQPYMNFQDTFNVPLSDTFNAFLDTLQVGNPSAQVWSQANVPTPDSGMDQSPFMPTFDEMDTSSNQYNNPPPAPTMGNTMNASEQVEDFVLYPSSEDAATTDAWNLMFGAPPGSEMEH